GVNAPAVTVTIYNNYISGLGNRDGVQFAQGTYNAQIYQNYIGGGAPGVRTDYLSFMNFNGSATNEAHVPIPLVGNAGNGINITTNAHGTYLIKENFLAGNDTNHDNNIYNLRVAGDSTVTAQYNWWGQANTVVEVLPNGTTDTSNPLAT